MEAHPLYHPLSWRGLLDPIKLAYDPRCRKLAPSSQCLKQLGEYASSPGHRGTSCYTELTVFFPSGDGRSHR